MRLIPALLIFAISASAKPVITYVDHVRPILSDYCLNCHNPDKTKGDLDLSTYKALLNGGGSGESVVPGNPDRSMLLGVITHAEEPEMPPKKPKIPEPHINTIREWIATGVRERSDSTAKTSSKKVVSFEVATVSDGGIKGVPAIPKELPAIEAPTANQPAPILAMATSAWAPVAAVAAHEQILIYNTTDRSLIGALAFPERIPHVLKFSRNGELLLAAGGRGAHSGKAVLFDVETGQRVTVVGEEFDAVLAADISADHKYIAVGGPNKLIKIYATSNGELLHRIKKHTDWVTALEFSPDGKMLATGDRAGGLHVWDPEVGGIIFTLDEHKEMVTDISWRSDGQMFASTCEEGKLILWDTNEGWAAKNVKPHNAGILSVEYNSQGGIVTAGRDKSVRVLSGAAQETAKFAEFADLPTQVTFTHDGGQVLAGDYLGDVRVWDTKAKKIVGKLAAN
jgi:WD40 repeat protein/mono/diheme cytochrome c family protein